jgi:hypothetical protein
MPDIKKSEYVTYKGSKILPLTETNIVTWMMNAKNLLIIEDLWQYVDPDQGPTILESTQKDDKTTIRQTTIARAVLSFLITHDFWIELDEIKLPHQIWTQIQARANQLKAQKQSLSLQELEGITYDSNKGMEDFINRISRKVAEIKGSGGSIADVTVSGFLIRALPKEFVNFKPYIGSMRDDLPRLKMELRKAEATLREEKLRVNGPNTSDSTSKALSVQSNQSGGKQSKNKDKKPKLPRDPDAYCTYHEYKGHDIKDCVSFKQAQKFFNSKGKDAFSTKQ